MRLEEKSYNSRGFITVKTIKKKLLDLAMTIYFKIFRVRDILKF